MTKLLGVLLVLPAVGAAAIGLLWVSLDAVGTEWDYCPDGYCIAGWKMGVGVMVVAAVVGLAGIGLLRRGSGSGERLR